MIGTRGVPARYGGFETCVEEVGTRLVKAGHSVRVYCRQKTGLQAYEGMNRKELPALKHRSLETLSHSTLSVLNEVVGHRETDVAFVFNAANSPLLPLLAARDIPVALHMDGLEWQRSKWGTAGQSYYRVAEAMGVYFADALISDAEAIATYYKDTYGVDSNFIPYGAPVVYPDPTRLTELDLTPGAYVLVVARMEPENHVLEALTGALAADSTQKIVIVGSVPYETQYAANIRSIAGANAQVQLLGAVWDQDLLDSLYAHCRMYIHGHSVGGTNPSLLRAMGAGAATAAFDNAFNRETLSDIGLFWSNPQGLAQALATVGDHEVEQMGNSARARAASDYQWDRVAAQYEALALRLANGEMGGTGVSMRTCLQAISASRANSACARRVSPQAGARPSEPATNDFAPDLLTANPPSTKRKRTPIKQARRSRRIRPTSTSGC
jgi:glycosyltransferase involved in cell wall biosynthesis